MVSTFLGSDKWYHNIVTLCSAWALHSDLHSNEDVRDLSEGDCDILES
jgi:hypothetical protein